MNQSEVELESLTVKRLIVTDGSGPKIHMEAIGEMVGLWLNDDGGGPSLGVILQKGQTPYLAFYTSNHEHVPAAISIDPETGKFYFQAAQK